MAGGGDELGGAACPYMCSYCWSRKLIARRKWEKYVGPYRIDEKAIRKRFKKGDFVFVQDMSDLGCGLPRDVVLQVFEAIEDSDAAFLLLTKNPDFYRKYYEELPTNVVLGATIETDRDITANYSQAPLPKQRLDAMEKISLTRPDLPKFISIEPIMDFSEWFARRIEKVYPYMVALGYDGYGNQLPEPSLMRARELVLELEEFTTVKLKRMREAWND